MSSRLRPQYGQLASLQAVIKSRLVQSRQGLQKALDELYKIEQEIETRRRQLAALEEEMLSLQDFLSEGAASAGDREVATALGALDYQMGLERRFWIDYDLQRERYYLELTDDEKKEQSQKVDKARKKYRSLKHKSDTLGSKLCELAGKMAAIEAGRQEEEFQDSWLYAGIDAGGTR